jgi:hypothetical protein
MERKMKHKTRRILALMVCLMMVFTIFSAIPASANGVQDVDLSTWTEESYPAVDGFLPGVWTVSEPEHLSVCQSINGQPTMFYSDFSAFDTQVQGQIYVSGGDDDYIGFALGFQPGDASNPSADYLLIDWKQLDQNYNFGSPSCGGEGMAYEGLAVSRVTGIPTADEFWQHTDQDAPSCSPLGDGLTELARGINLGNEGWNQNQWYTFTFEFNQTSLKVYVDGILEIDIVGVFNNGRVAFYNFSQAEVCYSGYVVEAEVQIDIKPGSDPNSINLGDNGLLPVAILGSEDFDVYTIDLTKPIELGGSGVASRGSWKAPKLAVSFEDVNDDGHTDLVAFFSVQTLVESGVLNETTTDSVRVVPPEQ